MKSYSNVQSVQVDRPLCPLCGERNLGKVKVVYDRELKLCRCNTCGMVFRVPLFGNLIGPKYELFYQELNQNRQLEVQQKEHQWNFRLHTFYDYILTQIVAKHGYDISILDIGCGPGNFLDRAAVIGIQHRVGIDPLRQVVTFNRMRGKQHCVFEGYYTREKFRKESFNVIFHSHVLEHVEFPLQFLGNNYYHLLPGGTLVVRVPSILSPEWWLQVISRNRLCRSGPLNPQHMVYFTPNTLRKSLDQTGFTDIRIQTGLWAYKYPKLRLVWKVTIDSFFNLLKLGNMLVFASRP